MTASRARRPSRLRTALFTAVLLLLLGALVEGAASLGFRSVTGSWFHRAAVHQEQETLASANLRKATLGEVRENVSRTDSALHPYAGKIQRVQFTPEQDNVIIADEQRCYDRSSPLYQQDPSTVVVAITGGSVAWIFADEGVPFLQRELQADPAFAGKSFLFVTIAFGGFKQPQQLMMLNYLMVLGAHFDIVVNLDGFNEIALHQAENQEKGVFPAYPRQWYTVFEGIGDLDVVPLIGEIFVLRSQRTALAAAGLASPLRWSVTYQLAWMLRDRALAARITAREDQLRAHAPKAHNPEFQGPSIEFADDAEMYDYLVDLWRRSSLQMDWLCRGAGTRYYHFLQPNQYVEGSKTLSEEELSKAFRPDHLYRPGVLQGYPRLIQQGKVLREQGVHFRDLTQIYAGVLDTVYMDDCCHVNTLGNEILAHAVATTLLEPY